MTPEYYKFPSGVQVIEISRYLTSNAGQALGYIARSSRLDGNNKFESPVDCLRKARDLIDDEINRLTPDPNSFRGFDGATYFWGELNKRIKDAPEPPQFKDEYHLALREPRQWNTLADVPGDVMRVTDCDGDPYRRVELHWEQGLKTRDDEMSWGRVAADCADGVEYAPYTEVIE